MRFWSAAARPRFWIASSLRQSKAASSRRTPNRVRAFDHRPPRRGTMDGPRRGRIALLLLLASAAPCLAQGTSGPQVSGSRAGYVDSAIPGDLFRFRYNSSYDDNRPSRAEFFWPQGGGP